MAKAPWHWLDHTEPFSAIGAPTQSASFVVEQIADKDFRIPVGNGFQYNPAGEQPITVTCDTLPTTDFASIPRYMSWFVSRHGRHTPAALVHDQLVTDGMSFEQRKQADRRFLQMMDDVDVPPVQGRVMWAAVTLATRLHGPMRAKVGLLAWGAMAAGGIGLTVWGLSAGRPLIVLAAAIIGPAVAALSWGNQYWAGLVAGYALPVVAVPALASLLGYWVYWVIEQAVKLVRQQFSQNRGKDLSGPIGYQGR